MRIFAVVLEIYVNFLRFTYACMIYKGILYRIHRQVYVVDDHIYVDDT